MKGEMSKMDEKSKIVEGAKQYSKYITTNIPQLSENGNVIYYFSGSLAMLLLNEAISIKSMFLDEDGQVVRERLEFDISEENRKSFARGIRPLSLDVDTVATRPNVFNRRTNIITTTVEVIKNCPLATKLCPMWGIRGTSNYFDCLESEEEGRIFKGHDIAEITIKDGTKVIIADPLCMLVHKLADAMMCKDCIDRLSLGLSPETLQTKYEKDINDFASMFNGIISHYDGFDFLQVINHIYETYDSTFSSLIKQDSLDILKQFYLDVKESIDEDKQERLFQFIDAVSKKNQEKIDERKRLV